jgi:hypothetical protein
VQGVPGCYQSGEVILDMTGASSTAKLTVAPTGSVRGQLGFGDVSATLIAADGTGTLRVAAPDSKGQFEFADVEPGRYRVAARLGAGSAYSSMDAGPNKAMEIEVKGGAPTEVKFP